MTLDSDGPYESGHHVRFQSPSIPPLSAVQKYYELSERARWYSNFGPCHELLCSRLEALYEGGASVIPVTNATLGLMVALASVTEPEAAKEKMAVILPSYTFIATGQAVNWLGFRPVFVDVDHEAWQLSPDGLAEALELHEGQVAAVLACSTFGTPPPSATRRRWETLCAAAGIPLVVDSAAGFGGVADDGLMMGLQGDLEVFSFHATKPFAVGEGGLVTAEDADVIRRVRQRVNFGFDEHRTVTTGLGLNAKMSELHAATALCVLDDFENSMKSRAASGAAILEAASERGFQVQAGVERSPLQFISVVAPDPDTLEQVQKRAAALGVETRRYFDQPLHTMDLWPSPVRVGDLSETDRLASLVISMPMATDLTAASLDRIVACFA